METLAKILGKSVRTVQRHLHALKTVQRHLHALKEGGLIEFVERRRNRGKFSSYLYRVVFFTRTPRSEPGSPPRN